MKKFISKVVIGVGLSVLLMGQSQAGPFTNAVDNDLYNGNTPNGTPTAFFRGILGVPDLFHAANLLLGTAYTRNEQLDPRFVNSDSLWSLTSSPADMYLIGMSASNANTAGIYTDIGVGNNRTGLIGPSSGFGFSGDGSLGNPYPASQFAAAGTFGWFLESVSGGGTATWFSESGLNAAGFDHLMTFGLPELVGTSLFVDFGDGAIQVTVQADAFLLGWEDLPFNGAALGDEDFNDMIYLVASVTTVPAPGALGIFAFGLAGLGFMTRRRRHARA